MSDVIHIESVNVHKPGLESVFWIRIQLGSGSESGSRRARIEKSYEISCFEMLDVFFYGLKGSPVAWTSFMEA